MRRSRRPLGAVAPSIIAIFAHTTFAVADERTDAKQACASAAEEAEQLRVDGRLAAARNRLLQCSRPECPAAVRTDCAQWMTEVAAAMPTVVLGVRDALGQDVLNARVWVDGVSVSHGLEGKPMDLDPGVHKFRFEASGATVEQVVLVREGEKSRAITGVLDLGRAAPGAPVPSAPAPPATSTSSLRPSPWTWALGGIGLVAVGIGAYLEASVNADASELQSTCGHSCSHAQVDPLVLKQQVLGPVAFGVGALSLGAATYTLFAAPVRGGATTGVGGQF